MRINRKLNDGRTCKAIERLEGRMLFAVTPQPVDKGAAIERVMIDHGGVMPPSIGGQGGGDYQLDQRWFETATNGFVASDGDPITLTWGLVADGFIIPGDGEGSAPSILQSRLTTIYGSMTSAKAIFQQVFDRWAAVTGITYVYTGLSDDGAPFVSSPGVLGVRPDVRIGGHHIDGASNTLAYNYFPGFGEMVIDTDDLTTGGYMSNTSLSSRRLRNVVSHEHGHGLGIDHVLPVNQSKLMEPFVTTALDGPQYDDILAAQTFYGDPLEKNGRNETAATATNKGALANGTTQLATGVSISPLDEDYFKITLAGDRTVSLTASPAGTIYDQGSQFGAPPSPFNSAAQSDLTLSLYSGNGSTLLRTVDLTNVGAAESINSLNLSAGTYFIRVAVDGSGATQMYSLSATASTLVTVPPVTPSTPDLSAVSDSGSSNSDNITNNTTPTITGTAGPLTTITLLANGVPVGTTTSASDGIWEITTDGLTNGLYALTAIAENGAGTSPASGALNVNIDTQRPTMVIAFDREVTQNITFTFSDPVASQLLGAQVTVANLTTPGAVLPSSQTSSGSVTTRDYNGFFADGRYRVSVLANAVVDAAGNRSLATTSFFNHLVGDADNNATVDFQDLIVLAQNYNQAGKTFSQGNFDYDAGGNVDFQDLVILSQKYNLSLPPASAGIVAPAGSASLTSGGRAAARTTGKKPSRDVLA